MTGKAVDRLLDEIAERAMLKIEPYSSDESRARTKAHVLDALREVLDLLRDEILRRRGVK